MPDEATPEPESPHIAELRAAAERGSVAARERDDARLQLAFVRAGLDTERGPGKLLYETWDGSEATKEAVLAVASEYGISSPGRPVTPAVEFSADEQSQSRERAALSAGSEPWGGGAPDPDPARTGLTEFHRALASGASREDASDHFFGRVMTAAAKGDPRAIVQYTDRQRETLGREF